MCSLSQLSAVFILSGMISMTGCSEQGAPPDQAPAETQRDAGPLPADDQGHDDGEDHMTGHDPHEEVSLGTTMIGDMTVECWQGHGEAAAGKEMHLVVKLPYSDNGATIVRGWIGTEDRLASMVGRGDYAASHDDYDIHAEAPDPLPENAQWWIEVEKPDGSKHVGAIAMK